MSSGLPSYPITEDWPYNSGGGSSYNTFGSEPPSSDPAFELYSEQEGHVDEGRDNMVFDEPPSSEWDYFEEDPSEVENAALGDIPVENEDFGEVDPFTDEEYLDLFGELPLELNRISFNDCSSVSSYGSGGTEQEDAEIQVGIDEEFRPNRPAALRADVLQRSLEEAGQPADFFCCICSARLYPKEAYALQYEGNFEWEQVEWPCIHYGHNPTLKNGRPSTCLKHRTLSDSSFELVSFIFLTFYGCGCCFFLFYFYDTNLA